jgi:hypothetical protein
MRKPFASLLAVLLLLSALPSYAATTPGGKVEITDNAGSYVRLKNKWKSNYLYEGSDGIVRYGITAIDDQTAQWQVVDAGGFKQLKNRATGHFITVAKTAKRGDALYAAAASGSTDDKWIIEDSNRPGFMVIKNAKDPYANLVIHEEDQLGFAEASGDINVTFESPQWMFEPVREGTPVRIVNQYRAGQYLYEDADGFVQFGAVGSTDTSSHWYLDPGTDEGTIRIVNRATGHAITQGVDWDKIKALPDDGSAKSEWVMSAASDPAWVNFKNKDALTADPAHPQTWVLNTQFPDDKYARSNNWAQSEWGSALWKIENAYDIQPVRIVHFTTQAAGTKYLYESSGSVKYGALATADAGNPAYLWIAEDFDGQKRIRNLSTGHYLSMKDSAGATLQALELSASAPTDHWLIANSAIYDDYKTIQSAAKSGAYIHVNDETGSAQAGTVDPDTDPAQWLFEDPSAPANGGPQIVRIQNEWQSLFLYEDGEGNLKYGNARSDDKSAQWVIEKFNGRKRIKNVVTGHYLNLENRVDGHIRVTPVDDDWTSAVWVIEDLGDGVKLIHSVLDKNDDPAAQKFIHLQNLTKYAEYGVINRNWGSPHWRFLPVTEEKPENVRLKNKATGQYLYEVTAEGGDKDKVKSGDVSADDKSSVWFLEDTGDGVGSVRLKNVATGHYYVMENVGGDVEQDSPPEQLSAVGDICSCWGSAKWYLDPGASEGYSVIRSGWAGHYIYVDDEGYTKVSKTVAADDRAQFAVEPYETPAPELPSGPVRIKNVYNNQYLYENAGGVVLYGTPVEDIGYSHWLLKTVGGVQLIQNRASGHYLALNGDYRYAEAKEKPESAGPEFQWVVETTPDRAHFLIRSNDGPFADEYLNVQNGAGYAERGLYPFTFGSLQWSFEPAPADFNAPSDAVPKNTDTSTPIFDDPNYVQISAGDGKVLYEKSGSALLGSKDAKDQAAQWLLQDFNGRRLIQNRATGHLLSLDDAGAVRLTASRGESSQWMVEDRLGLKTLQNAKRPDGWLKPAGGSPSYGDAANAADAMWRFTPVVSDIRYEAEEAFLSGGASTDNATAGYTGQGYATGFSSNGSLIRFAVNAAREDRYRATIRYQNADKSTQILQVTVNGIGQGTVKLPSGKGWKDVSLELPLRSGINTVTLENQRNKSGRILLDSLTVKNGVGPAYRGATVPYVSYEAEYAATNAEVIGPSRRYLDMASEASGRQAVRLNATGDYVEFKLAQPANALTLRYAIPDSADGKGLDATLALYVNGKFKQNLKLTSKYAWEYGSYPWTNDPNQGSAHRFFDEIHALIGNMPAGATIRLQKDKVNTADYYVVDVADFEQVASPLSAPKNFLSVTKYGAVANDGKDDTTAFKKAMAAAKKQGKGVWFPAGEFELGNGLLYLDDVTIRGAGMWYTTLNGAKFMGKGRNIQVYDLMIDGKLNVRDDEAHTNAFEGVFGPGSVLQNIWIEHTKTGLWLTELSDSPEYTDGLHMVGLRIRNLMADGINFCVGTSNSRMEQSEIRYPGDDGIAMWSFTKPSVNNTARFNTVSLPWLADNIVVFGGTGNKIQDNVVKDTIVNGAGIAVSTRFNPVPFAGTTVVERNTLIRTGSHDNGYGIDLGAIWIFASDKDLGGKVEIRDNVALNSTYGGLLVHGTFNVSNVTLKNLVLDGMGTNGVEAASGVKGTVDADNVIIRGERIQPVADFADGFQFVEKNKGFSSLLRP